MSISAIYNALIDIACNEFPDVVTDGTILAFPTGDPHKVHLDIVDGSIVDIYLSLTGRYAYHWERRLIDAGMIFRQHDNAPHQRWRFVSTFPKHFHNGSEENVMESFLDDSPPLALRQVLVFVRHTLLAEA